MNIAAIMLADTDDFQIFAIIAVVVVSVIGGLIKKAAEKQQQARAARRPQEPHAPSHEAPPPERPAAGQPPRRVVRMPRRTLQSPGIHGAMGSQAPPARAMPSAGPIRRPAPQAPMARAPHLPGTIRPTPPQPLPARPHPSRAAAAAVRRPPQAARQLVPQEGESMVTLRVSAAQMGQRHPSPHPSPPLPAASTPNILARLGDLPLGIVFLEILSPPKGLRRGPEFWD